MQVLMGSLAKIMQNKQRENQNLSSQNGQLNQQNSALIKQNGTLQSQLDSLNKAKAAREAYETKLDAIKSYEGKRLDVESFKEQLKKNTLKRQS
ncbi:MAG: hypothetical protein M0C28_15775 [Candidatus Moduliflexus flocculans]|nr:hypothetical protein [Candidatus Moduliflexus flocculans]